MKTTLSVFAVSLLLFTCTQPDDILEPAFQASPDLQFVDQLNEEFYQSFSKDFQTTKSNLETAISSCVENQWTKREALSQKNYAIVLYMLGEYEPSFRAIQRSANLYDSLQDKSGLARVMNEMGNFLRKQGRNNEALKSWDAAESLAKDSNDLEALGTAYGMKGTFYWLQKDFEKSDAYYFKCYDIRLQQNDSVGLGYVLIDLADMAQRKGNLELALDYFEQSNHIRETIRDHQGIVDNYKMMGDLFMKNHQPRKAITHYLKSASESVDLGYPDLARKNYDSLSSAYALLDEFESAFQFQKLADQLEDSLFNAERAKALAELQTKYETEKKEQQITLQHAEISEQKAQNQRNTIFIVALIMLVILLIVVSLLIKNRSQKKQAILLQDAQIKLRETQIEAALNSQETERKRFARDLHDGFGQMISVLNLNLKALEKGTSSKEEVFENSSKVLDDMYKELKGICFNLMPETLIKNGVIDALREFANRVNQTGKVFVEIDSFGIDKRLDDLQEISIYRITQEWINNMLKYSDADKVTVSLTKDEEEITLLIEDNGSGFDKNALIQGTGNGWKNINSRANLIKGELELDTSPGIKGSTLIINSPARISQYTQQVAREIPS